MADDSITDDCIRGNNVVPLPREIIAQCNVRECRREVERLIAEIETADPDTRQGMLTVALGERLLEHRRDDLRKAEAALAILGADDAIHFGDKVYRAERSPAGAN